MNINTTDKVQTGDSATGTSTSTTWRCPYTQSKAERGWECPRCGRVNAPWVRQCDCSNKWDITWAKEDYTKPWWYDYKVTCDKTTANNEDWWKTYVTCAQADTVGGSDYWDNAEKIWSNVLKNVSNVKEIY